MTNDTKLQLIKLLHTIIWLFFNVVIFYMAYAILTNRIDWRLYVCYGLIILEGVTLLMFKFFCPLTIWAKKYSNSQKENFDIFLPNWLAKYNKLIYTSIVVLVTIILLARLIYGG